MRIVILAAALGLIAGQASAAGDDAAEAHLRDLALTCIRSHAADVERVEPSLTDSVSFLLDDLCSRELIAHDLFVQNSKLLAEMRSPQSPFAALADMDDENPTKAMRDQTRQQAERTRAAWKSASVDPTSGELNFADPDAATGSGITMLTIASTRTAGNDPEGIFRAAAADAVLAARTARLDRRP
jgi:hypothetical protein